MAGKSKRKSLPKKGMVKLIKTMINKEKNLSNFYNLFVYFNLFNKKTFF